MTREEAKSTLAASWSFERVDGQILLRDVSLIEAVLSHTAEHPSSVSPLSTFVNSQTPRSA